MVCYAAEKSATRHPREREIICRLHFLSRLCGHQIETLFRRKIEKEIGFGSLPEHKLGLETEHYY
jgi:hypothetical protein